jgi:hypothetical protein
MVDRQGPKQELLNKAKEFNEFSSELNAKFAEVKRRQFETEARYKFFSRDRKSFWRMPVWLWVPLVSLLVALFLLALFSV